MIAIAEARQATSPTIIFKRRKRLSQSDCDRRKPLYQAVSAPVFALYRGRTAVFDCIKDGSFIDPAMGSGSLMLNIRQFVKNQGKVHYHGQELNTTTYNLARMNLILHNVEQSQMRLRNGDTLDEDWPTDEPYLFNAVVMNPPYSANWSADDKFLSDPRFERFGKLAPKSKADFSFLLHGFYHLNDKGTM